MSSGPCAPGWRALFADDLDELKAVNERQARYYTEAHTLRAVVR